MHEIRLSDLGFAPQSPKTTMQTEYILALHGRFQFSAPIPERIISQGSMEPMVGPTTLQTPRPPLKTRYQFIEEAEYGPNEKKGRKSVRRHVMLEHMRQKRWQEKGQLDRDTLLEQKGFKIDSKQIDLQSGSASRDRVNIIPLEPAPNLIAQSVEDNSIEEIPRNDIQKQNNPYNNWLGFSPDPIDRFLANATPKQDNSFSNLDRGLSSDSDDLSPPSQGAPSRAGSFATPRSASVDSQIPDYSSYLAPRNSQYTESVSPETEEPEPVTPPEEMSLIRTAHPATEKPKPRQPIPQVRSPSPRTLLGSARKDPFNSLPIRLKADEHALVDHFVTVIPFDYYGTRNRRDFVFNWFRDVIFPVAMKGPVAFRQGVLGYAAIHKARIQGLSSTPEMTYHASKAFHLLKEHFEKNPRDCSDQAIAVSLIQATFDDFTPGPNRKAASWTHMRSAMRMMRTRGGPKAFAQNPRMVMLANCYDYRISGYQSEGSSFNWSSYPKDALPTNITPSQLGRRELCAATEDFIHWLRNLEHLALVQRYPTYASLSPRRYKVFLPGTSLYNIIASPPGARRGCAGYQHQLLYGMSVLIHLNAALWDFRRDSELSERFLKEVCLRIVQNELDTYTSVEALAQIMLRPSEDPELHSAHIDRLWFVGRMLKVAKRLSKESWERLRCTLLGFLTFEDVNKMADGSVFMWEDSLRKEVLEAEATCYVMPALQFAADEL
jgi:hypothetical protein